MSAATQNIFGVPAGREGARAFAARLLLALAYGLKQAPEEDRKAVLRRGQRELWFLAVLVVQWWTERLPAADQIAIDAALADLNLKPLAKQLNRVGERLEPLAKAAYVARTDAALSGAGVYFGALLSEVGASTLVTAIGMLLVGRTLDVLHERFAPQPWLDQEFRAVLDSEAAKPDSQPKGRAERFERADLGSAGPAGAGAVGSNSDLLVRGYFRSVGWSDADIERILSGPSGARKA